MKSVKVSHFLEAGLSPATQGVSPPAGLIHARLFGRQAAPAVGASVEAIGAVLVGAEFHARGAGSGGIPRPIDIPAYVEEKSSVEGPIRKECLLQVVNGPHLKTDEIIMEVDLTRTLLPENKTVSLVIHCGDTALGSVGVSSAGGSQRIRVPLPSNVRDIWRQAKIVTEGTVVELPLALLNFRLLVAG